MSALEAIIDAIGKGYEGSASEIGTEVVSALERAGFVIAPMIATTKMVCAALDDHDERRRSGGSGSQSYSDAYAAMIEARPK